MATQNCGLPQCGNEETSSVSVVKLSSSECEVILYRLGKVQKNTLSTILLMKFYTICVCFSLSDAFSNKKLFPKIAFQAAIFGTVLNLQNEKNCL